jgi:hypothetical protein
MKKYININDYVEWQYLKINKKKHKYQCFCGMVAWLLCLYNAYVEWWHGFYVYTMLM